MEETKLTGVRNTGIGPAIGVSSTRQEPACVGARAEGASGTTSMANRVLPGASRLLKCGLVLMTAGLPVLANFLWVLTQRQGQPLTIDEAGYAVMSLRDYLALSRGGPVAWWREVVAQPVQAPLAPALASVVHAITGPRVLNVFVISVLSYGLLLAYTLGLTIGWPRGARVSALLIIASTPVLLTYSRLFEFAELAAACLASALYCQHRSRVFSRWLPSLGWGASLGLMLLARTMTIAFVPGLVVGAVVPVLARRSRAAVLRFGVGLVVAAAVAATWYVHNLGDVYSYLTKVGYGAQAAQYGAPTSIMSPHDWFRFLINNTNAYVFVGEALVIGLGWLLAALTLVSWTFRRNRGSVWKVVAVIARDPIPLSAAIVSIEGLVALMTSRNQGTGFLAPLMLPLVLVAVWGLSQMGTERSSWSSTGVRKRHFVAKFFWFIAAVLVLPAALLTWLPITRSAILTIPFFDSSRLTVWDSQSYLIQYEESGAVPKSVEQNPGSASVGSAWLAASAFVDKRLHAEQVSVGHTTVLVLTFRNIMLNANTIQLDSLLRYRTTPAVMSLNPLGDKTGLEDYWSEIGSLSRRYMMVATATSGPDEIPPPLPRGLGWYFVSHLRLQPFGSWRLPDGRIVRLWVPRKIGGPSMRRFGTHTQGFSAG